MSIRDIQSIISQEEKSIHNEISSYNDGVEIDSKKYQNISPKIRLEFIKRVLSRQCTIKEAAQEFKIKFSTAKAILQTFKREGRVGKKKTRSRKPRSVRLLEEEQEQCQEPVKQIVQRKKLFQNQEELQEVIKQIEKDLGPSKIEEHQQTCPEFQDSSQQNPAQPNNVYQLLYLQQQQLNSVQMQNQMLHGPLINQYKEELQKQKQINSQLLQYIQNTSANQQYQQIVQNVEAQQQIAQQSMKSLIDFGSVKEEDGHNYYITPLQSFTNLEQQIQPNQNLNYSGSMRDLL